MIKVGITGGIGSGKSYISSMFEKLGVPVYYSDIRAKELMNTSEQVKQQLISTFGAETYKNNQLDRKYLAEIVFNNEEKLELLNNIVHPAVKNDYKKWCSEHQNYPYTLKEAALLFETGIYKELDKTILVHASKDIRILRVMQRDKVSKQAVEARMDKQMDDFAKMDLADYIVHNDGINEVFKIVEKLHTLFNPSIAI
ncbi:MAG: dephospho-CoA kinase [Chitinophagales bacterium]